MHIEDGVSCMKECFKNVVKRDGRITKFDSLKIKNVIKRAGITTEESGILVQEIIF